LKEDAMTLTLHAHPLSSYCWKALIALYEYEAPFAFHQIDFQDEASADAFRALWPLAKMPVLVEDDGPAIAESSIVIEYLTLHHAGGKQRLIPADGDAALEVRFMDRVFDHYVMTPVTQVVFNRIRPAEARDPYGVGQARELLEKCYAWLDGKLSGREWAAGSDFSMADCAAAPSLHYAEKVQPMAGRFPTLAAYLARLEARPSVARVLREAEPFGHFFPQEPE
jgi:glutathione S-transferase